MQVLKHPPRLSNRKSAPQELNTVGDHPLRRRLVLKLPQRQVAEQIGVDKTSIANWEGNRNEPGVQYIPAIIRFLGYNPLPPRRWVADRLVCSVGRSSDCRRKNLLPGSVSTRALCRDGHAVSGCRREPMRYERQGSLWIWKKSSVRWLPSRFSLNGEIAEH
jgi:transcriptional regulator with XRE-family HTH domain